jgi:hypothetical protein
MYRVPNAFQQLKFFLGEWFSQNGGLLVFWPVFALLTIGTAIYFFFKKSHQDKSWPYFVPAIGMTGMLLVLTLGLARWYAPFGWLAYGTRLLFPWAPPLLILFLYFYSQPVIAFLRAGATRPAITWTVGIFISILSLSHFSTVLTPKVVWKLFGPMPECMGQIAVEVDPVRYYPCIDAYMWKSYPILLTSIAEIFNERAFLPGAIYFAALMLSLFALQKALAPNS